MNCTNNDYITCSECIFNNHASFSLEEVAIKDEDDLQKILVDCTEDELEEIKDLLRDKGYNVI